MSSADLQKNCKIVCIGESSRWHTGANDAGSRTQLKKALTRYRPKKRYNAVFKPETKHGDRDAGHKVFETLLLFN